MARTGPGFIPCAAGLKNQLINHICFICDTDYYIRIDNHHTVYIQPSQIKHKPKLRIEGYPVSFPRQQQ